ncbi:MAG: methyltransferase [Xanthomonadales bacterium]|nr:class I SAM-dependent methyltransferase [Xanthomonadales bacterium]NIX11565.1 methyltransferase [Xanthomonadales bacterium]
MHLLSRLLLRNASRFYGSANILLINPPADLPWRDLFAGAEEVSLFSQDFADCRTLRASGAEVEFGVVPHESGTSPDTILLALPREKERLRMLLHWCSVRLPPRGRFFVAGENLAGGRSAGRHLRDRFDRVSKRDSARHCTLFEAGSPRRTEPFGLDRYLRTWRQPDGARGVRVSSLPGVFSHGGTDSGTALLLDNLAAIAPAGRVLDFGCGSGVIGLATKALNPGIRLSFCDSNAAALEATRRSLEMNGMQAEITASSGFCDLSGPFDFILTNPPFHEGHRTRSELSIGLLAPVRNFLAPGGQLVLVVNRHLPYARWLESEFGEYRELAGNRHFRLLHAVKSGS